MKDSVVEVYQSVYSLQPYSESEAQVQLFSKSWKERTQKTGFLFVGALDSNSQLVGFSYGWNSSHGDLWNTRLSNELAEKGQKWLSDCFEFVDLAVRPSEQGFGLGRDLTKELFAIVKAETAILLTHQTTTKASEMYLRNGWIELQKNFEVAPGKIYQVMGKVL